MAAPCDGALRGPPRVKAPSLSWKSGTSCLQLGKLDSLALPLDGSAKPLDSEHGRRLGATHRAVERAAIGLVGGELPRVHGPAAAFRADQVLQRHVLGEEAVLDGLSAEDAQAALVADGHLEPGVHERLPVLGVALDVPDGAAGPGETATGSPERRLTPGPAGSRAYSVTAAMMVRKKSGRQPK